MVFIFRLLYNVQPLQILNAKWLGWNFRWIMMSTFNELIQTLMYFVQGVQKRFGYFIILYYSLVCLFFTYIYIYLFFTYLILIFIYKEASFARTHFNMIWLTGWELTFWTQLILFWLGLLLLLLLLWWENKSQLSWGLTIINCQNPTQP